MACPKSFTKDGFNMQFSVNHLSHFYLTQLLTEKLKASAPARVVIVSSSANSQFVSDKGIDFDNLNAEKKKYSAFTVYGQFKLANIYHAKELQRRFDEEGVDITVTSLHPGFISSTGLSRHRSLSYAWDFVKTNRYTKTEYVSIKSISAGASTQVYCTVSPDAVKGEFYSDNIIRPSLLNEQANNVEAAKKLWVISEQLLAEKNFS